MGYIRPTLLVPKKNYLLTSFVDPAVFGDLYDAVAFSITLAFGAVDIPFGSCRSLASRAYSTSMCLINGEDSACRAKSGSSSS